MAGALTYAALGAAEGLGRGVAQIGGSMMQDAARREDDARRQAEWDRQQREKDEYFQKRTALRDQYADENRADRAGQGGAIGAAGGSGRGGSAGSAQLLMNATPEQAAEITARMTGARYDDQLAYEQTTRGMRKDLPPEEVLDKYDGRRNIEQGTVNNQALKDGAGRFQRAFFMLGGKNPDQIAEGAYIDKTGRKPSSLTDEQVAADVGARKALAEQRVSNAGLADSKADLADRSPGKGAGGRGGGGTKETPDQKDERAGDKAWRVAAQAEAELAAIKARASRDNKDGMDRLNAGEQMKNAEKAAADARKKAAAYGERPQAADSPSPKPTAGFNPITKAEFDKLPSGTAFIAPDGSRRTKP